MRFTLIIAAALLHLTSAVTVPKSNVKIFKRATDHKSVFAPGWPQLLRSIDDKPANLTHAFTFETTRSWRNWFRAKWDGPDLEFRLNDNNLMIVELRVSLVRPARKAGDPPFPDSTGVVHGEREGDRVVTEQDVVGLIEDFKSRYLLYENQLHIEKLANGAVIPDGEFHVAIEVLRRTIPSIVSCLAGEAASENSTNPDWETWISPRFKVAKISKKN